MIPLQTRDTYGTKPYGAEMFVAEYATRVKPHLSEDKSRTATQFFRFNCERLARVVPSALESSQGPSSPQVRTRMFRPSWADLLETLPISQIRSDLYMCLSGTT